MVDGEMFDVRGYDIVARCNYAETGGEAIVLCNNSSHFIVAIRQSGDDDQAEYEKGFAYFNCTEEETQAVYRSAVNFMFKLALSR